MVDNYQVLLNAHITIAKKEAAFPMREICFSLFCMHLFQAMQ